MEWQRNINNKRALINMVHNNRHIQSCMIKVISIESCEFYLSKLLARSYLNNEK